MKPILFQFDDFIVPSYSFMMSMSFLFFALILIYLTRKKDYSIFQLCGLIVVIQLSSLLGSRIVYILNENISFIENLDYVLSTNAGGFSINGGMFFGLIAAIIYVYIMRIPIFELADFLAPCVVLCAAIIKIGCFLGGCCFGIPSKLLWAVQFPEHSFSALKYGVNHAVHPIQLYEVGLLVLLFIYLIKSLNKTEKPGFVFASLVIGYSLVRLFLESLKSQTIYYSQIGLTQTQFVSILLIFTTSLILLSPQISKLNFVRPI